MASIISRLPIEYVHSYVRTHVHDNKYKIHSGLERYNLNYKLDIHK